MIITRKAIPEGVKAAVAGLSIPPKVATSQPKAMTKEQVENWIMLKGQTGERWFKIEILDDEVGQDKTMIALMETVSDMIFAGIQNIPFAQAGNPDIHIVGSDKK